MDKTMNAASIAAHAAAAPLILALALPVVGAIKANDGSYYRYPVVGVNPD